MSPVIFGLFGTQSLLGPSKICPFRALESGCFCSIFSFSVNSVFSTPSTIYYKILYCFLHPHIFILCFYSVHLFFNPQFRLIFYFFKSIYCVVFLSYWLIVCNSNVYILHLFIFSYCLSFYVKYLFLKDHKFSLSFTYTAPFGSFYTPALFCSLILSSFLSRSLFSHTQGVFVTYTLDYTASHPVKE